MKRSEMIQILEEVFSKYDTGKNIAERALTACENAGMAPPTLKEDFDTMLKFEGCAFPSRGWESEQ